LFYCELLDGWCNSAKTGSTIASGRPEESVKVGGQVPDLPIIRQLWRFADVGVLKLQSQLNWRHEYPDD
jgi:hypothetical protein